MHAKNQWLFKTIFSWFLRGLTPWGFGGFGPLFGSKNQFFSLFFRYCNFLSIFERFEEVLEGFGEDLGRAWEGLGKVWGGFGEAFGLILDSKMMFGDQSGAGMFKKCLGTFVWSFDLVFLDVWGWGSKATGQNEVGPADRAQRLNIFEGLWWVNVDLIIEGFDLN